MVNDFGCSILDLIERESQKQFTPPPPVQRYEEEVERLR